MRWFNKGFCVCGMAFCLVACAQDKKLPEGVRVSVLDDNMPELALDNKKIKSLPAPYVNTAWSQAGVNPQHIIGNLQAGFTLKEKWAQSFGKGINKRDLLLAAPVVGNNSIFVMDTKGKVSAFNLESGKMLWENQLSANVGGFKETKSRASGLAFDNNTLFATTGFGGVFAMNAQTGAPKWRKVMESPIRIAPTVTPNMLLVQTVDNRLYALDKTNGQEIWRFGVAHEDTVIAGGASPAYDAEDNVVTTEINTVGAYPIVEEGVIYAISNSDVMASFDMRTGDKLWEKEIGSMQNMLLAGDYLFVVSNKNILYALEKYSGNIVWSLDVRDYLTDADTKAAIYTAPPLMLNGHILLAFSNGKILKVDATNGLVVAKTELELDISNGLIAAEQKVIAVSDDADVIVFE